MRASSRRAEAAARSHRARLQDLRRTALLALLLAAFAPAAGRADEWRFTALEENDSNFFNSDKHYTQGIRFSLLGHEVKSPEWQEPFHLLAGTLPIFQESPGAHRRYALLIGQSIFTPKDISRNDPDRRDRPYAGWLYAGASMLQETGGALEHLEIDLGMVGPAALGEDLQNGWHRYIRGIGPAAGWNKQVQNEPGLELSYERLWRVPLPGSGGLIDVVPELGATAGNVFTYGSAGALVRFGNNLGADYGPVRVRPALSGTDYFDDEQAAAGLGSYAYAGIQGRAVGRNLLIEGNSFRSSRGVDLQPLVADFVAGVSVFWSSTLRLDFSVARRTREFAGQSHPDVNGTGALSFHW